MSCSATKNFDTLSNDLLFYILRYLPFKDLVRVSRVSQRFNRVSKSAIAGKTSLKLKLLLFTRISSSQLAALLNLCRHKLEEITLDRIHLIKTFSDYTCPKLTAVTIFDFYAFQSLTDILSKNKNLRSLRFVESSVPDLASSEVTAADIFIFPANIITDRLRILKVHKCDNASLLSLTGRVPNLESFSTKFYKKIETNVADEFFASVPKLKELAILESYENNKHAF